MSRERRGRAEGSAAGRGRAADPGLHQRDRAEGGRRLLGPRPRDRLLQATGQGEGQHEPLAGDDPRAVRELRQERDGGRSLPPGLQGAGDLRREDPGELMRICLMIEGQESVTWEEWVALAKTCEESPIEALFRSDHYLSVVGQIDRGSLDAWATLAGWRRSPPRCAWGPWSRPSRSDTHRCSLRTWSPPIRSRAAAGSSSEWARLAGERARLLRLPLPAHRGAVRHARGADRDRPPRVGGGIARVRGRALPDPGSRRAPQADLAAQPDRRRPGEAAQPAPCGALGRRIQPGDDERPGMRRGHPERQGGVGGRGPRPRRPSR